MFLLTNGLGIRCVTVTGVTVTGVTKVGVTVTDKLCIVIASTPSMVHSDTRKLRLDVDPSILGSIS